MVEHVADRPSWDCRVCDKPWPCDPAREQLVKEYDDLIALRIFLWTCLEQAVGQMPASPAGELFERFLAWAR